VLWKQKIGVEFYPILKQYVISPLLQKSISDKDQLSNYHPISNHFSHIHIIPLRQPSCISRSPHQCDHNNNVCVSSTLLLPLTPTTIAPYSPAFHPGLVSTALSSTGVSRISHLSPPSVPCNFSLTTLPWAMSTVSVYGAYKRR